MINYIFQSSLTWILFLIFFHVVLSDDRQFQKRRYYLIISLFVGLILPIVASSIYWQDTSTANLYFNSIDAITPFAIPNSEVVSSISPTFYWLAITLYVAGVLFMLLRFAKGVQKIFSLKKTGIKLFIDGISIVINKTNHAPFSFFQHIYINENILDSGLFDKIIKHESAHINQKHSLDIILVELLQIVFWFNPLILKYKRLIKINHEHLADEVVLHDYSLKEYCNTLLSNLGGQLQLKLSNQFFQSQLKTRIKMMNKNTKTKQTLYKYYGILPIIFGLLLVFSKDNINRINLSDEVSVVNKSELQDDGPEEMPRFPGCEDVVNMDERKSCAMTKLIEFLSENIVYPQDAKINNIEGMNVAKFVVGKDGTLENIELLKDIGYGTGESTLNAVRSMNEKGLKWIPGKKDGKAVRVEFTLPIKYKLTDEDKKK